MKGLIWLGDYIYESPTPINNIMSGTFCVFDVETSGLSPATGDKVIELAAVRFVNGVEIGNFSCVINNGPVTPKIIEITKITNEMIASGMDEVGAIQSFLRLAEGATLIAHNAGFDLRFIHYTLMRLTGRTLSNPFYDTLTISRERTTYPHTLGDMCTKYGIKLEGAHRALNDVYACWELFKSLNMETPVNNYLNRLGYMKKYGREGWYPEYADVYPLTLKYENSRY
jgi:DNA polymerase-3 subunit epsilon